MLRQTVPVNTSLTDDEYSAILLWLTPDDFTRQERAQVTKMLKTISLKLSRIGDYSATLLWLTPDDLKSRAHDHVFLDKFNLLGRTI